MTNYMYFLHDSGERRGGALTTVEKMERALRYLADPSYQTSVTQIMIVSQSTVLCNICTTLASIVSKGDE